MSFRTLLLISGLWLIIGFAYVFSLYLDAIRYQTGFILSIRMVLLVATVYISWTVLTIALLKLLKKPVINGQVSKCLLIFLAGLIIWQPIIATLDITLTTVWFGEPLSSVVQQLKQFRFINAFLHTVFYIIVFFVCVSLIYYRYSQDVRLSSLELKRRHAETELSIATMQMQALQSQLSPHFLFNCLNSISGLARTENTKAIVSATARLGELLRFAIMASKKSLINLSEEIEFVQHYVELQRLRFDKEYRYRLNHPTSLINLQCPPFILQSLVENAFIHTEANAQSMVIIQVDISQTDDTLSFSVSNTLPETTETIKANGLGTSLNNLQRRLEILYHQPCLIHGSSTDGLYKANVRIPLQSTNTD